MPPKGQDNNKIERTSKMLTDARLVQPGEEPAKELSLDDIEVLLDFEDLAKIINNTLEKIESLESTGNAKSESTPGAPRRAHVPVIDLVNPIIMERPPETEEKVASPAGEPIEEPEETANRIKDIITNTIDEKSLSNEDDLDLNDFLVETKEHIESIEMNVLMLESDPSNMELIHSLFRDFHTIKGLAGFVNQEVMRKLAHQTETQLDKCRKGEIKAGKGFVDLILTSSDYLKKICDNLNLNQDHDFINTVSFHVEKLNNAVNTVDFNKTGISSRDNEALGYESIKTEKVSESLGLSNDIRISIGKIDNLVDLIGEFAIIQSQVEQEIINRLGSNDLLINKLLRISKISKDVQNLSISLRMISLKSVFQKINRIARDAIQELNKNVMIEISGQETEIDRGVVERLLNPLLHLVKNAISHGIEDEAERIAKGKPAQGKVEIRAYSKRGNIYIEVLDDGNGINLEHVRQKAIERKLIKPGTDYTDEELINLIFLPGFSTVENINNVSGRGVGLDVR